MRLGLVVAVLAAVAVMSALAGVPEAHAHGRSVSYSTWTEADGSGEGSSVRVVARFTRRDLAQFTDPYGPEFRDALPAMLLLSPACEPTAEPPRELEGPPAQVRWAWTLRCSKDAPLTGARFDLPWESLPGHAHMATFRLGPDPQEAVVVRAAPSVSLASDEVEAAPSFPGFLWLGVEHLIGGPDHLLFLLVLILAAATLGEVALAVTGFTLGHSLTLALALLDIARPADAPVEALIGLSIALVAVENVWLAGPRRRAVPAVVLGLLAAASIAALAGFGAVPGLTLAGITLFTACWYALASGSPARVRVLVAGLFGLVHGFGFAGALGPLDLPPDRLVTALLGFNLGLELGQLAVLAALWPLLLLARRALGLTLLHAGSALGLALGLFWFLTRTYA